MFNKIIGNDEIQNLLKQAIKNKGYCGLSWVEFSMNKDETLQLNWRNSV